MPKLPLPNFDQITRGAFCLFGVRLLATPVIDPYALSALALLTLLLAGGKGLQIVSERQAMGGYRTELEAIQSKLASLSVAVGLGGRK